MARKAKSVDGLQPAAPHSALDKILSWKPSENPTPPELIDWLVHQQDQLLPYLDSICTDKELILKADELKNSIKTGDYVHLKRWQYIVPLLLNYLDVLDGAADVLEGTTAGRVTDAFSQGVRLGILHERLLSLVDGRCQDHWLINTRELNAADKANKKKSQSRPDFLSAVKAVLDTGVKFHPACQQVADDFGVDKRTVVEHTKRELAPRRNRKNA